MRAAYGIRPTSVTTVNGREIVDNGMVFFWQCQGSRAGKTECNTFKILDINAEGRGPCMRDPGPDFEPDEEQQPVKKEIDAKTEAVERVEPEAGRADERVSDRFKQDTGEPASSIVKNEPLKEELAVKEEPATPLLD